MNENTRPDSVQLEKYEKLKAYLKDLGKAAIAFSSGVDSTFLLYAAKEALGENVIAVTASSASFPQKETEEAKAYCEKLGVKQFLFYSDELNIEGFAQNPKNRCYICKHAIFSEIIAIAKENGIGYVAEGSNMDDLGDYRPGLQAVAELNVKSPLRAAALTKEDIRVLSKEFGLPTWNKPSFACLASRFVYGETISEEKLHMVEKAEELLAEMGFKQYRVRIHGTMARIELLPEEFPILFAQGNREKVVSEFKKSGFTYVTMDLMGYRTGSMNEVLKK